MSHTVRTVAVPGMPPHTASESARVRVERGERIAHRSRAAKVIGRADRWTERHDRILREEVA